MVIFNKLIKKYLQKKGFSSYMADYYGDHIYNDWFKNKEYTIKRKIWCYKKGFCLDKLAAYGLNESNYKDYLNDYDYYRMHPINSNYCKWIDDKLIIRYILSPYKEFFPEYYYQIGSKSSTIKLMDLPEDYGNTTEDIIKLLQDKGVLVAKRLGGALGLGFYKFEFNDNRYLVNNKETDLQEIISIIDSLRDYLICEYVTTDDELNKIWPMAANTVRIITINNNGCVDLASSFVRFGTSSTEGVDNFSAGGIAANVDIETGKFSDAIILDENKEAKPCLIHPDTKVPIEGILPNWDLVKSTVISICNYIPQVIYMGFDIAITNEGFKIIEINSHSGIRIAQHYMPFMKNSKISDFFKTIRKI